jgi:hypothetical protein
MASRAIFMQRVLNNGHGGAPAAGNYSSTVREMT